MKLSFLLIIVVSALAFFIYNLFFFSSFYFFFSKLFRGIGFGVGAIGFTLVSLVVALIFSRLKVLERTRFGKLHGLELDVGLLQFGALSYLSFSLWINFIWGIVMNLIFVPVALNVSFELSVLIVTLYFGALTLGLFVIASVIVNDTKLFGELLSPSQQPGNKAKN